MKPGFVRTSNGMMRKMKKEDVVDMKKGIKESKVEDKKEMKKKK